ncbi:ABC transporter ATP-binding protein [Pseudozobellia thermophila]|uniref:Putative ABC transport system ATP-binding protein n=1 Tax=Pseudozobellia thermophila TaxID=192903 RepID=A0A1M6MNT5_9FLAO|nr:ATP-binding cassette domain-containing protein [Pseudozobellia thermophila]SHJ84943.1 putative ABC transport system ATP-binding protein [Pseudozobellia thermophila]
MVEIRNLSFQYASHTPVLRFPDIHLKEKERLLILGRSGVGKTTLLHLMAGLLTPKEGLVKIGDVDINTLSDRALDRFRGRHIGMVFQNNHALRSLTVLENIKARLFFSGKSMVDKDIETLLGQLQIGDCKNQKINELSVGQLQRLGIAMAFVHRPRLLLADEPTSSLDDLNCATVLQLLKQQAEKNKANLVVITHDKRIKSAFKNVITL